MSAKLWGFLFGACRCPQVGLQLGLWDQPRLVVVADLDPATAGAGGDAPRAGGASSGPKWMLLGLSRRCWGLLGALAEQGGEQVAGCRWHGLGVTACYCRPSG